MIATIASGQSPQGMVYVPNAVPSGDGTENLSPLGKSGDAVHLTLAAPGATKVATTVAVNNQGLIDLLHAAVTGLQPKMPYVLALSNRADGSGSLEPLVKFMTNPAGESVVDVVGPLRKFVEGTGSGPRRYLVVAPLGEDKPGAPVQVQR